MNDRALIGFAATAIPADGLTLSYPFDDDGSVPEGVQVSWNLKIAEQEILYRREVPNGPRIVLAAVSFTDADWDTVPGNYIPVRDGRIAALIAISKTGQDDPALRQLADRYQVPLITTRRQLGSLCRGRLVPLRICNQDHVTVPWRSDFLRLLDVSFWVCCAFAAIVAMGRFELVSGVPLVAFLSWLLFAGTLLGCAGRLGRGLWLRQRYSTNPGEKFWEHQHGVARNEHYPQAIVGYRSWVISDAGELIPLAHRYTGEGGWLPGRNVARCRTPIGGGLPPCRDLCPGDDHDCGFNAYHWVTDALRSPQLLQGAIVAGGAVQVHSLGFRSELAAPVALLEPSDPNMRELARKASERYRIPLCRTHRQLAEAALASGGRPVPRRAIPPYEPWGGAPHTFGRFVIGSEIPGHWFRWMQRCAILGLMGLISLICFQLDLTAPTQLALSVLAGVTAAAALLLRAGKLVAYYWRHGRYIAVPRSSDQPSETAAA